MSEETPVEGVPRVPVLPEVGTKGTGLWEVKTKRTLQASSRENRDITHPVKRALGGAPVREVPLVEGAPMREQALAPVPVPRRDASLGERGGSPSRQLFR